MDLTPAPPRKSTFLSRLRTNLASPALEETKKRKTIALRFFSFYSFLLSSLLTQEQNDARTCTKKASRAMGTKKKKASYGIPYLNFLGFLRVLTKWLQLRRALSKCNSFLLFLLLQLRIKNSRVRGEVLYQMHCGARPFFSFSIFAESRIQEI
jgi:hypothetical protein